MRRAFGHHDVNLRAVLCQARRQFATFVSRNAAAHAQNYFLAVHGLKYNDASSQASAGRIEYWMSRGESLFPFPQLARFRAEGSGLSKESSV
jgi:hypothetical protein